MFREGLLCLVLRHHLCLRDLGETLEVKIHVFNACMMVYIAQKKDKFLYYFVHITLKLTEYGLLFDFLFFFSLGWHGNVISLLSPACAFVRPQHIPDLPSIFEIFSVGFVAATTFLSSMVRVRYPDDSDKSFKNGWNF